MVSFVYMVSLSTLPTPWTPSLIIIHLLTRQPVGHAQGVNGVIRANGVTGVIGIHILDSANNVNGVTGVNVFIQ